jgi:hypothetical protein
MFGNNSFIGFLVAASSPTQRLFGLRRKAEVPYSGSGLRDGRRYKRRCVYPGTETERERERELYPFRISIRFFARHHTVSSGPAIPLCFAASRVLRQTRHYVLFTSDMSSRRRVVTHGACFTHFDSLPRFLHCGHN